jgi:Peptidase family M50.
MKISDLEKEEIIKVLQDFFNIYSIETKENLLEVEIIEDRIDYKKFRYLKKIFEEKNFLVLARKTDNFGIKILVGRFEEKNKKEKSGYSEIISAASLVATSLTLYYAGYYLYSGNNFLAVIYMLAILTIIGLHEMGHYIIAKMNKLKISLPVFLPAPPILGTFGAVMRLKEFFVDRYQAFDVSISGPLLGLIPTVIFAITGTYLSGAEYINIVDGEKIPVPFMYYLILKHNFYGSNAIYLHPLAFAALLGFLITFLNISPAAQLDGGYVVNSIIENRNLIIGMAIISILLVQLSGFLIMSLLILFLLLFTKVEFLNEVSSLDLKRKLLGIFLFFLWILLLPIKPDFYILFK